MGVPVVSLVTVLLISGCGLLGPQDVLRCVASCDECKKVTMECTSTEGNKIEPLIRKGKIL